MSQAASPEGASVESLVSQATDEFLERLARGERPEVEEYARRHPPIAAVLRQLLPALQALRVPTPGPAAPGDAAAPEQSTLGCLGDFRLVREVGRGGMGVVYEAEQLSLGRRVALKVLPFAAALDATRLQRFKNEAQAAAHLQHQHIVPVYGVGSERGVHFYAMQFVDGHSLAELIRELRQSAGLEPAGPAAAPTRASCLAGELAAGRWAPARQAAGPGEQTGPYPPAPDAAAPTGGSATPPAAALSTERSTTGPAFFRGAATLGVQAAEALEHAHSLGVVHRDIKPANLLVDARGNLWVTDFGLAHCRSQAGLTLTGDVLGTLRYMSPEQALGRRVGVDHRTDVYSLGATLYELLTLEPAFGGQDRQELLRQIAFEEPTPPRRINKAIPAEVETVLLKAMEKNPAERYATARELADDLGRYLRDEPIRARRPTPVQRAARWARRHRPLVRAAVVALLAVAVALAFSTWQVWQAKQQSDEAKDRAEAGERRARQEEGRANEEAAKAKAAKADLEATLQLGLRALDKVYVQVAGEGLPRDPQREQEYQRLLKDALEFYAAFARRNSTEPGVRQKMGHAYVRVAQIQDRLGQRKAAERAGRQAVALFARLRREFPDAPGYRSDLAESHTTLGDVLENGGRLPAAEEAYRQAVNLHRELVDQSPKVAAYRVGLARSLNNLGTLLKNTRRLPPAERAFREARDLALVLRKEAPGVPAYRELLGASLGNLGNLLKNTGRLGEAEEALRRTTELEKGLAGDFPTVPRYRDLWAASLNNLGEVLRLRGRLPEAESAYREALTIKQGLEEDFPRVPDYKSSVGGTLHNLGMVLKARGKLGAAREHFEKAVRSQDAALGLNPRHPTYRRFLSKHCWQLADTLLQMGEHAAAAHAAAELPGAAPGDWRACDQAARFHLRCALTAEADAALPPAERKSLAQAYAEKAKKLFGQAAQRSARDPKGQGELAWFLATAAPPRFRDPRRAVELAKKAVAGKPREGDYWNTLGVAYYRAGDSKAAVDALEHALPLRSGGNALDWFALAMAHWQLKDQAKARDCYARGLAWMKEHRPRAQEFHQFRAEAGALLGAESPRKPARQRGPDRKD
jgi:eukaryotic-like serine/threonine-protein kinase